MKLRVVAADFVQAPRVSVPSLAVNKYELP
jgi:hypothetical protein